MLSPIDSLPIDPLDAAPSLPYLAHTTMVIDAIDLIDRHGEGALVIAATRAVEARNMGNALRFCHWRQTERLIALLRSGRVYGAIH